AHVPSHVPVPHHGVIPDQTALTETETETETETAAAIGETETPTLSLRPTAIGTATTARARTIGGVAMATGEIEIGIGIGIGIVHRGTGATTGEGSLAAEGARNEGGEEGEGEEGKEEKEAPNFALSGKLAAETNTYKGVVLKYSEPAEARKPTKKWRLYVFKGNEQIADIAVDHPSCSKQHSVLQFRQVPETDEATGQTRRLVKPFIIDLESTNGTWLNGDRIPESRYVELRPKDVIKFGSSTREYVLLHDDAVKQ
ncbi:SMAD/FHA domain-containing protein, partial [Jimgerdemannia flammicorona]